MTKGIYTVNLPDIGEGVVEGEIIEWRKKVGESVIQDEPVVVVMTDKATVELPAPYPGVISKHYFKEGEISIRDKPLYDIQLNNPELAPSRLLVEKKAKKESKKSAAAICTSESSTRPCEMQNTGKVLAIPKVRQFAKELGIDLSSIKGTGKDGQVLMSDLSQLQTKKIAAAHVHRFDDDEKQPLVGVRGLMARRMEQTHIPQFSYFEHADVTRLMQMRQKMMGKAIKEGVQLSYMPFFIRALSLIAEKYPVVNSSIDMQAEELLLHKKHNIGVAIASPQGLIVPVLKELQGLNLEQIIRIYEVLKGKAKVNKFSSSDMKEATITISNFGVLGDGMWATPMISESEVAILAIARMRKMAVVRDDQVVVRDMLPLSWSFDHRVIDGELAAKISRDYCALLNNPAALL